MHFNNSNVLCNLKYIAEKVKTASLNEDERLIRTATHVQVLAVANFVVVKILMRQNLFDHKQNFSETTIHRVKHPIKYHDCFVKNCKGD